jgi:hypothetical protein
MDNPMKKILLFSLVLILAAGLFSGCKKDKGKPPVLPPQESMVIDFSNFDSKKKSVEFVPGIKGTETSTYDFAAFVAVIWKSILNTSLSVPVASFKLAVSQTPTYLSTNNWQWSYSVTVANVTYKARLTGQIRASDVVWKMYITKEGTGGFTDFLWYDGTSRLDLTGGQWIIYQNTTPSAAIIQIDWTSTNSSVANVKFTYVKNDELNTSYIEYGLTSNTLNGYYTIHYWNGIKFSDVKVEWNTTTHNGRVQSVDYLGDSKWYCWDSNKVNIVCP